MGRTREIFVNKKKLLRTIAELIAEEIGGLDRQLARCDPTDRTLHQWPDGSVLTKKDYLENQRELAFSPTQDLELWAGKRLTDSQRIRWQQAVRALVDAHLLARDGRQISLTSAGWTASGVPEPPAEPRPAESRRRWKSDAEKMFAKRRADRDLKPPPVIDPGGDGDPRQLKPE